MSAHIDLNADLGEGVGTDANLISIVSSASIACGGHAGDARTMRETVRLAKMANVRIGAHPGFEDKASFGRKRLDLPANSIATQVVHQVGELVEIARQEGADVSYVKLHGALANMAAEDDRLAETVFAEIKHNYPGLAILALDSSGQTRAAIKLGLAFIREAYADRAYNEDGTLVSRSQPGAVLHDPDAVVAQCLGLALKGQITTKSGMTLQSQARSICLHGDTPGAVALAARIAAALETNGVTVSAD